MGKTVRNKIEHKIYKIMNPKFIFLSLVLILLSFKTSYQSDYLVTDYGIIGDAKTLNTENIQNLIDQVSKTGGGKIIFPAGKFLSGSIELKDEIELYFEAGAVLLGSKNPFDYKKVVSKDTLSTRHNTALISAHLRNNVKITGYGTVNGQGGYLALALDSLYYADPDSYFKISRSYNERRKRPNEGGRPNLIFLNQSKNIQIKGVTLKNGAEWVTRIELCDSVVIDNIKLESDVYWNNDGIDLVDSKNVRITNSDINAADDAICFKSHHKFSYCENIYVSNCKIRSSASAVKFGTASHGGFKNIELNNLNIYDTYRSAIALEAVDGGFIDGVKVSNIKAVNTGNAIFIKLGHRNAPGVVGSLQNVEIKNIDVTVPKEIPDKDYEIRGPMLPFFHNKFPSSITGIPGYYVKNVSIENVVIRYPGGGNQAYANMPTWRMEGVPENKESYPEFSMFGELPAWGLYVRHVSGLNLKNIRLEAKEADYRPSIVLDDVNNSNLSALQIKGEGYPKQIVVKDVKNIKIITDEEVEIIGKNSGIELK
jgi:polygalacturonase